MSRGCDHTSSLDFQGHRRACRASRRHRVLRLQLLGGDPARHAGENPELVCIIPFYTVRLCFSRLEMAHKRPAATQAAPGQRRAGARLLSWRGTLLIGMQQHKRPAPHSTSGLHTAAQAACAPPHKRPAPCRIYGRQPPRTSGLRTSGPPPRTSGPPPHRRRRGSGARAPGS